MSTVKQIESALEQLPVEELQEVRDWLDDFIEDQLEPSDEFKAKVLGPNRKIMALAQTVSRLGVIPQLLGPKISRRDFEHYPARRR